MKDDVYVGVDVQIRRGCCFYAMSSAGKYLHSGWIRSGDHCASTLLTTLAQLGGKGSRRYIGIDAPRMPLPSHRKWSWRAAQSQWSSSREGLAGRHCEVVVMAHKLASPQWTPLERDAPKWMQLGFTLYAELSDSGSLFEIFPSAAYRQLEHDARASFPISLRHFVRGPKDMLDAAVGAFVMREFVEGRGCEVGGGDGLGTISLALRGHVNDVEQID